MRASELVPGRCSIGTTGGGTASEAANGPFTAASAADAARAERALQVVPSESQVDVAADYRFEWDVVRARVVTRAVIGLVAEIPDLESNPAVTLVLGLACATAPLPIAEQDRGRSRPGAVEWGAVVRPRRVLQPAARDQRCRGAAVEIQRRVRAEQDEQIGQLREREPSVLLGPAVDHDAEDRVAGQGARRTRIAAVGDV